MWKFSAADKEAALLEKFTLAEGHAGQGEISIVIWTTTPWTLPANRWYVYVMILNTYWSRIEANGEQPAQRIIIASELAKDVMDRAGIERFHNLGFATGADLELSRPSPVLQLYGSCCFLAIT